MEKLALARILRKYIKKVVFPIIGTIIAKRSSAAIVRTICVRCFRVLVCHVIQFNCDVTLRPRFNAYVVVSVYKANLAFQCQKFRLAIPLLIGRIPVQKEKFGKKADQLLLNGCRQSLKYIT